jgi:hypothetical protein
MLNEQQQKMVALFEAHVGAELAAISVRCLQP